MTTVTILGTGNMGSAIAALVEKAGHTPQALGSADTDTPVEGEIVIFAVPHTAIDDVLA